MLTTRVAPLGLLSIVICIALPACIDWASEFSVMRGNYGRTNTNALLCFHLQAFMFAM